MAVAWVWVKSCDGEDLGPKGVGRPGQKGAYNSEFLEPGANGEQVFCQDRRAVEFDDQTSRMGHDSGCDIEQDKAQPLGFCTL